MDDYQIEKDIPIPKMKDFVFPFNQMLIGDSFLIPLQNWLAMGSPDEFFKLLKMQSPKDYEYTVRSMYDGFRVWRIK